MEPKLYRGHGGFILSLHQLDGNWLLRGSSFKARLFFGKNPFPTNADSPSTKLSIGNIPISVVNSEIKKLTNLTLILTQTLKIPMTDQRT